MGDGMHKRGLGENDSPPSPQGRNFSWLLNRSIVARKNSDSNPPPPPAPPSGGGGSRGGPPAAS
ncbi:MAG: hypothetical protein CMB48_06015 [Euryarchaeota archaeon]|mgnify:FL=1|nr:hypothetical protein [Euryarchaeota archaeon]|tara:strand:+ start:274 stop:465 length:192 start_codon:yes stop_codon:yes gene_type:complete